MVRTFKLKPWVYAGLLALSPLSADAAGLGKLTITSALGQPLRAEIELVAVEKNELDSLSARIASAEAFREAQIERNSAVLGIKFSVEQRKDGKPIIKLSTVQPLNEPFLDMLVELNWAAGRLLREYTVLLDPPGYAEPQSVQPVIAPSVKPSSAAAPAEATPLEPAPAPSTKIEPPKASKADKRAAKSAERKSLAEAELSPAEPQPDQAAEAKNYGPVKKGDTLTGIASQLKPQGFSLDQMLAALYQNNKQAFIGNNMNRLKSGQILRVPDEQQLAAIGHAEAAHEVKTHTADWNAYRQKLAATVAETPAPKEEAPKQLAHGKITSAVEDKAAPAPTPSKDVLKVTKGEAPASGKELQALQGKLQSLQEETTAKGKSLKEANDRIASLEKSIKDMQQLIELKNKNLADLQKQAAAKPEPVPAVKSEPTPAPKPEVAPVKPAEPVAEKQPEAPKPVEEKPVAAKPKPAPAKVIAPPSPPEASLLDSIMDNPLNLAAGAGALALLAGGAMIAINRRRRKSLSSFEDSILTGGDLKANTVFGETAGGVVDTGDTSFLTDFSQAGLGTIDTNDVDPIAEAEVYMAYGRDAQAEEILKEAMAKDPNRHEVHLKLLEIYASRKNLIAFETLAGELYASIGGKPSTIWSKAAEMGHALDPNNPLYSPQEGGARPATEFAAPVAAAADTVDMSEPTQGLMEADLTAEDMSTDLDFDAGQVLQVSAPETKTISEETPAVAPVMAETPEEEIGALEFDLDAFAEKPLEIPQAIEVAPTAEEEQGLEFDLDELMPHLAPAAAEAAAPAEAAVQEILLEEPTQAGGLELDLDAFTAPAETEAASAPAQPPVTDAEADLDFSLELPATEQEAPQPAASADESIVIESAPAPEQESHLDFDFDIGSELMPATMEGKSPAPMPELDLSGISLDLEEPAPSTIAATSGESEGDLAEVATKLDLARAYVEMGDKDGAREILEEVLKEGGAQQQADANQLLASL